MAPESHIDAETVRHAARLARIAVSNAEVPALTADLDAILGWVEQLQEVDVGGVEPMTSVTPMALKRRADEVTAGDIRDDILANAPDTRDGFFAVPRVVE